MVGAILSILSAVIIIYTILCLIAIFITWIPGAKFTKFGRFITAVTEPYLRLFSRITWLRFGNIDFSPILAIAILSLLSSILGGVMVNGVISFRIILTTILSMFWSVVSSLITIILLLILIRWIVLLVNKGQVSTNSGWYQVDLMLQKFVYKLGNTFFKNNLTYQKALLVSWISLAVILIVLRILMNLLLGLCNMIPF